MIACTSFGKARAAVADAGKEEVLADAPVEADGAPHVVDVGAHASHRCAISFMNEILVASIALAAYLVISALRLSMTRIGLPVRTNGS